MKAPPRRRFEAILAALFLIGLVACQEDGSPPFHSLQALNPPAGVAGASGAADPALAVCPETGDLLLAWAMETDGEWNLHFARSSDGGTSFTNPVQVNHRPGDLYPHAEGAPRLVAANGALALFWNNRVAAEARTFAGSDMLFSRSTDGGRSWTDATALQDPLKPDNLPPRGHSFHGAGWAGDSTLVVIWIDGRERDARRIQRGVEQGLTAEEVARDPEAFQDPEDPADGDGTLYAALSHDLGQTWEEENLRLHGDVCPCCRIALARDPEGGLQAAWRGHFTGGHRDPAVTPLLLNGASAPGDLVRVHEDGWTFPGCPHSGPALEVDEDGVTHVVWFTGAEGRTGIHHASRAPGEDRFSEPRPVLQGADAGIAHPALVAVPGWGVVVAKNVTETGDRVIGLTGLSDGRVALRAGAEGSDGGTHPQVVRLPSGDLIVAWTQSSTGGETLHMARLPGEVFSRR